MDTEQVNNTIELDKDAVIHAIYMHEIQHGGSIGNYWCDLNRKLFNQFLKGANEEVREAVQSIYNITSEDFFAIGWKTCLEMQRGMG